MRAFLVVLSVLVVAGCSSSDEASDDPTPEPSTSSATSEPAEPTTTSSSAAPEVNPVPDPPAAATATCRLGGGTFTATVTDDAVTVAFADVRPTSGRVLWSTYAFDAAGEVAVQLGLRSAEDDGSFVFGDKQAAVEPEGLELSDTGASGTFARSDLFGLDEADPVSFMAAVNQDGDDTATCSAKIR